MLLFWLFGSIAQRREYPLKYQEEVVYWSEHFGVEPQMIYAVIDTESGFDEMAKSSAGAIGLMQMTQDTFNWIKSKIAKDEALVFEDLYSPDISIRFGVYFFSYCLNRYGKDLSTAAAAYHSGTGTVDGLVLNTAYSSDGIRLTSFPYRQMNHYVNKINKSYQNYVKLYNN